VGQCGPHSLCRTSNDPERDARDRSTGRGVIGCVACPVSTQNPVTFGSCGFDSHLRHQPITISPPSRSTRCIGRAIFAFPSLYGAHTLSEVRSNLFPPVQAVAVRRSVHVRRYVIAPRSCARRKLRETCHRLSLTLLYRPCRSFHARDTLRSARAEHAPRTLRK